MLSYSSLKEKHRSLRSELPDPLGLRIHRALSWLQRSEMAGDDQDAAFIFQWIAFNAAYAAEIKDPATQTERTYFEEFFKKITDADANQTLYDAIWKRFPQEIRLLLDNQYVFQPFWRHQNQEPGYADWKDRFERSKHRARQALASKDARAILSTLFERLYVLRNQLVHGGATWNSSVNRDQVRDGSRILGFLVPLFIDLMMDNSAVPWGPPYYPVVD